MPPMKASNWQSLRGELDGRRGVQYWRSLEELAEQPKFAEFLADEFPRWHALWEAPVARRRVLKLMAASLALAGLTGCENQPEERIVPYVDMPEGLTPGIPRQYATSALIDGYAHGVLAQTHEGRPVKLEGNPEHPSTLGACDIFSQASVLSLYDPDRASAVKQRGHVAPYRNFLTDLQSQRRAWSASQGEGLAIVTGSLTSPSELAQLQALLARWPRARWHRHVAVDRGSLYDGTQQLFGTTVEPVYRFERARVVVSLDADFLQSQPGFLRYARDLMAGRRPRDNDNALTRLYVAEATPTITGSVADHRLRLRADRIEILARQLATALGIAGLKASEPALDDAWLSAVADDLRRQAPDVALVAGDQQPAAVHAIVQAINHRLGAYGNTVTAIEPVDASHRAMPLAALVEAMRAGDIDSLIVMGSNPAYNAPGELGFAEACGQVPWRCHFGETFDETARLMHWHIPATHPLETWSDARAHDGTISLLQPMIRPLHGGLTSLQFYRGLLDGVEGDPRELLMAFWRERDGNGDFEARWRRWLHDGMIADSAAAPGSVAPQPNWQNALPESAPTDAELVLQLSPDPALWDGRHANNGWLQELPRPLTKLTWDNALLIAPALAEARGLGEGDVVRLAVGERHVEVPVYILPGMPDDSVTLTLGHGRPGAGHVAEGIGSDAYRLQRVATRWAMPASLEATGEHRELATTQNHHAIEDRDLIRVASLETYRNNPRFAQHEIPHESLYPEPWPAERKSQYAWGMVIDLSSCIGCNACVTACQAENNIPIVGPEEVKRGREMHWIRIDRYFEGPLDDPQLVFQPVTCMHCENAPCEYVCPVGATQHTASGLNAMVYNRCVGTRYCSQNCPYKVRRFNWFQYTGQEATYSLPKAVQNPEVTVRAEGVMEKCTYCVQRIMRRTLDAELEGRGLNEGELQTACQQTCPTRAIVFGDLNREDSEVARLKEHPLHYAMLANLNVRPRTTYLAAVTNPNPALESSTTAMAVDQATHKARTTVGHYTPSAPSTDTSGGQRA
ncbi:prokaryotic molybdopterin-containing oxidoreductase family, iron-sulfur binding subunit [Modicisalibacter muralis]|uniref:Prokaryotic molybdopterin-containing oxidoreductase family, iron-sulfur binding subunit n=1 Tax=Modicisalibacter muralis TaxID=119000 RepID=A0A1G9MCI7_9GAMM|nr:TAT-variant-translocated molybdopterin oxidoreductase [Halomonas muralis]SDL71982.1 prokaryotic molybdopterin-containing oxidoreductase family, iron-sulfur binding subunit [Halomonas muralis]